MLNSISFPKTLKNIGEKAFQFCGISSINLPGDTYISKNYLVGSFGSQNISKKDVEKKSFKKDEHGNYLINIDSLFNIKSDINQDLNTPKVNNIVDQNGHNISFYINKNTIIVPADVTSLSFNFANKTRENGELDDWASPYYGKFTINFKDNRTIYASHYTMTVGDPAPTASDFKASALNFDGDEIPVNVDLSKANLNKEGTYEVTLSSDNGYSKNVSLFVKNKETSNSNNNSNRNNNINNINNNSNSNRNNNSNNSASSNFTNKLKDNNDFQSKVNNENSQPKMPETMKKADKFNIKLSVGILAMSIFSFVLYYLSKNK